MFFFFYFLLVCLCFFYISLFIYFIIYLSIFSFILFLSEHVHSFCSFNKNEQGPVVQSIISLTSSLRGQLFKCFMTL